MSLSPLEYLRHVLDEADYLAGQVSRLTRAMKLSGMQRSIGYPGSAGK